MAIVGLFLGAFIAPTLVRFFGLVNYPFQDALYIGFSVLGGFLLQFLVWLMFFLGLPVYRARREGRGPNSFIYYLIIFLASLPVYGVCAGLYFYSRWTDPSKMPVTIGFIGAFLIKAFLIPFVKGIVTGTALKWLISRLRPKKQ